MKRRQQPLNNAAQGDSSAKPAVLHVDGLVEMTGSFGEKLPVEHVSVAQQGIGQGVEQRFDASQHPGTPLLCGASSVPCTACQAARKAWWSPDSADWLVHQHELPRKAGLAVVKLRSQSLGQGAMAANQSRQCFAPC